MTTQNETIIGVTLGVATLRGVGKLVHFQVCGKRLVRLLKDQKRLRLASTLSGASSVLKARTKGILAFEVKKAEIGRLHNEENVRWCLSKKTKNILTIKFCL